MGGTIEEIKQAIVECLREIYPRGRTEGGMSITCFRGKTGADGQPLVGWGDNKLKESLDGLVAEEKIASYGKWRSGEPIFHYKTDAQPPVVGHMEEIKLAIVECLCRIYPDDRVRVGIELECFKDRYDNTVIGADGLSLVEAGAGTKIRQALDELSAEGKIDAPAKERDGEQMAHYKAKAGGSVTPENSAPWLAGAGTARATPPETGPRDVDTTIPAREDDYNEFKETFSVPVQGGKANDVKREVVEAVAAFANAKGGRLFVGVRDDGTIAGLKRDLKQYKNADGLERAIWSFLESKLNGMVDIEFDFSGGDYLVIVIRKNKELVFTKDGDLYVRLGNRSKKLTPAETAGYQRRRLAGYRTSLP